MISKLSVSVITNTAFQRSWSQQAVKSTESAQHCNHSWEHDSDDIGVCVSHLLCSYSAYAGNGKGEHSMC